MNLEQKNRQIRKSNEVLVSLGLTIDDVVDAMPDLLPRFRKILSLRFGLDNDFSDGNVYSLREIAAEFGVSPSHISNIEKRALEEVSRICKGTPKLCNQTIKPAMKHADKIKMARKMRSRKEIKKHVPIFESEAWEQRKANKKKRLCLK